MSSNSISVPRALLAAVAARHSPLMVDLLWTGIGATAFALHNTATWQWYHCAIWVIFIMVALEFLSYLVIRVPPLLCPPRTSSTPSHSTSRPLLRVRGSPLQHFTTMDHLFCTSTKLGTALFSYHMLQFCYKSEHIAWSLSSMSLLGSPLVATPLLYLFYDFFYYFFHRTLHIPVLYGYIHKHHHRQTAPSRGNPDAINIHPIEMGVGEYNHLWCLFLLSHVVYPELGIDARKGETTGRKKAQEKTGNNEKRKKSQR